MANASDFTKHQFGYSNNTLQLCLHLLAQPPDCASDSYGRTSAAEAKTLQSVQWLSRKQLELRDCRKPVEQRAVQQHMA